MNTYDKVMNACHRLNAESYEMQALCTKKRKQQFVPCAKAEQLMKVLRNSEHFGTCHLEASITPCACHPTLTETQLMDYEYDDTYTKANHASNYRVLYPRLYNGRK